MKSSRGLAWKHFKMSNNKKLTEKYLVSRGKNPILSENFRGKLGIIVHIFWYNTMAEKEGLLFDFVS